MKQSKRRLDRLEANAGDGGQHIMTIRYLNDWREPPAEPVTRAVPGLKEDVTVLIEYVKDWQNEAE